MIFVVEFLISCFVSEILKDIKGQSTNDPPSWHRIEINTRAIRVGTFKVYVHTHVALRMFIVQFLPSQLPFLANTNTKMAVPPLF